MRKVESQQPKIVLPHPGTSYNPEYDDHQRLLLKAHEVELKKLKKEEKELKKWTHNIEKMSWREIEVYFESILTQRNKQKKRKFHKPIRFSNPRNSGCEK